jgi:hypothetical protein
MTAEKFFDNNPGTFFKVPPEKLGMLKFLHSTQHKLSKQVKYMTHQIHSEYMDIWCENHTLH